MNWLDSFAITLVPYFAGAGSLAAFLFFFGKRIFFHILSKDIEKYKSQLGEKAEVLKNQLSIYAFEQNVTYSRIDNQRATAIGQVFSAIRKWTKATSRLVSEFPIVNAAEEDYFNFYTEHAEEAHKSSTELSDMIADNSIYFDEELFGELAGYWQLDI